MDSSIFYGPYGTIPYCCGESTNIKATSIAETRNNIEDGGERMTYSGGALREPATGKGRYDLISPFAIKRMYRWDDSECIFEKDIKGLLFDAYGHINLFRIGKSPIGSDYLAETVRAIFDVIDLEEGFDITISLATHRNLSPIALERLAKWYELGSIKYSERNWEKGISYSRCLDSALRHLNRYCKGERTEDHLAAIVWNLFAIMHYEAVGLTEFDDLPRYDKSLSEGATIGFSELAKSIIEMDEKIEKGFDLIGTIEEQKPSANHFCEGCLDVHDMRDKLHAKQTEEVISKLSGGLEGDGSSVEFDSAKIATCSNAVEFDIPTGNKLIIQDMDGNKHYIKFVEGKKSIVLEPVTEPEPENTIVCHTFSANKILATKTTASSMCKEIKKNRLFINGPKLTLDRNYTRKDNRQESYYYLHHIPRPSHRDYNVYAVLFDGCLVLGFGEDTEQVNVRLLETLINRVNEGDKIILWTDRKGKDLQEALDWCNQHDLKISEVNRSVLQDRIYYWEERDDTVVYADVYLNEKIKNNE